MHLIELARRLARTTLFASLPRVRLVELLEGCPRRQAGAGEEVEPTPGGLRQHLVLLAGEVELARSWTDADGQAAVSVWRVGVAADGPGFALVSAAGSGVSVRALQDVDYLAVDSDALDDLLGWGFLGAFVLPEPHLKLFHRLPLETVARALRCLQERPVQPGETIVRQGEPGEHYFVILEGEAEVFEADAAGGEPRRVNRLVDGDAFGEEALLAGGRRTATVTMATPGRLLVLGRDDFDTLLRPPMVEEIDAQRAQQLVALGQARLLDCRQPDESLQASVPGAVQVPLARLRHDGVFELDPDADYIVVCPTGRRSRAAAYLLRERGVNAAVLAGGLAAWPYALGPGVAQPGVTAPAPG